MWHQNVVCVRFCFLTRIASRDWHNDMSQGNMLRCCQAGPRARLLQCGKSLLMPDSCCAVAACQDLRISRRPQLSVSALMAIAQQCLFRSARRLSQRYESGNHAALLPANAGPLTSFLQCAKSLCLRENWWGVAAPSQRGDF